MASTPPGPMTRWSMLAAEPGMARSCRTAHPCRSRGARRRAVRCSPAAPRRQATVSLEVRKRSSQPSPAATVTPVGPARLGATRAAASHAATPAATRATTRQGRPRAQVASSVARRRRYSAAAEAPGRPTLARTRTATTDAGPPDLTMSFWSSSWSRWASRAARSAWLRGRIDTPDWSSSQEGQKPSG
jgi:hypothetical protein